MGDRRRANEPLDPALVRKARAEEIDDFRQMRVYKKVLLEKCMKATGKRPIGVRWIDINKGDAISPKYRSRFVAKHTTIPSSPSCSLQLLRLRG